MSAPQQAPQGAPKSRATPFLLIGLVVALLVGAVVSGFASSSPDGLEKVAGDKGFLEEAEDHDLADSPLADYGVEGVDNERLSVGLAGIIGVLITLAIGTGLFFLVRRRDVSGSARSGERKPVT